MSSQAYVFAHQALPALAFSEPGKLLAVLSGPDGPEFLQNLWGTAGQQCDPPQQRSPEGLAHSVDAAGTTGVVAAVHLPEPQSVGEAHFVAIFGRFATPEEPDLFALNWVRVFTLEYGLHPIGENRCTMLCEWTEKGTHKNYGEGPPPDEEAFVQAALDVLWEQKERAESPPDADC